MTFQEVKPVGGYNCRVCGTWSPEPVEVPCPGCPGKPYRTETFDALQSTYCKGCGQACSYDGRDSCLVCWDCVTKITRTSCKFKWHKGKRSVPSTEVDIYLHRYRTKERQALVEDQVQACKQCYYLYRGKMLFPRYDKNGELVEPTALKLFAFDPLWRYGGRESVWRPKVGEEVICRLRNHCEVAGQKIAHGVQFPKGVAIILASRSLFPLLDFYCYNGNYCKITHIGENQWNVIGGLSFRDISGELTEEL